jgi:glycosyltransferase involved in cell wall biosynthesis
MLGMGRLFVGASAPLSVNRGLEVAHGERCARPRISDPRDIAERKESPVLRPKVLHIMAALPVGGAETLLLASLKAGDQDCVSYLVCSLSDKGPVGEEMERAGIEVIPLGRMGHKRFDVGIILSLCRLMRHREVDIVHTHLYHAGRYGRIAAALARVPCVVATFHNIYKTSRFKQHCFNWALGKVTDRVIAVSEAVKDHLVRYDHLDPASITVVPNGIDLRVFSGHNGAKARRSLGVPSDAYLIGTVGRLEVQKGQIVLLQAMRELMTECPEARGLIVGGGSQEGILRRVADDLGLRDRVIFTGLRRDIPELLAALDLFVLPSLWEGFPLALLEAMASGLPVVATSVGGVPEIISDRSIGILIDPRRPDQLVAAIMRCRDDRQSAVRMAEAGRRWVEQCGSIQAYKRRLEALYLQLLQSKVGHAGRRFARQPDPMREGEPGSKGKK